jgi:hypothetical protein
MYKPALARFEQAVNPRVQNQRQLTDAFIRAADCYYMERDYHKSR